MQQIQTLICCKVVEYCDVTGFPSFPHPSVTSDSHLNVRCKKEKGKKKRENEKEKKKKKGRKEDEERGKQKLLITYGNKTRLFYLISCALVPLFL